MTREKLLLLGTATALFAITACREEVQAVSAPSNDSAPKYIPSEQLPIKQEGAGFIRYFGNPSAEHLQYLQQICGDLQISKQTTGVLIGTTAQDCEARIRARRR